jgi:diaminopimelate epimerase
MSSVNGLTNPGFVGLTFVKGHGTGNDFILYADPDGRLPLDAPTAAWLADRRRGVGADGVIRAVRTAVARDIIPDIGPEAFNAEWFMDYRNADGSLAEMCGNGARVFVEFLRAAGLVEVPDGKSLLIGTRGGIRRVWCEGDDYAVDMGGWSLPGADVEVRVPGLDGARRGLRINVPNPHVVVEVTPAELDRLDLSAQPHLDPPPPEGANVEFIAIDQLPPDPPPDAGRLVMRVWERGSGETQSCGTGAVAAAIAAQLRAPTPTARWRVEVPGGVLGVRFPPPRTGDTPQATLIGPALLVYQGAIIPYTTEAT